MHARLRSLALVLLTTSSAVVSAQESAPAHAAPALTAPPRQTDDRVASDPLFPGKGQSTATFLTGLPYAGIAEYAYGFTDRFAVGAWAGLVTPEIIGYGLRLRYLLAQPTPDFRIHVKAPLIYYPKSNGHAPWYLVWPTLSAEWQRRRGQRLWTGFGAVATWGGEFLPGMLAARSAASSTPARKTYGSASTGSYQRPATSPAALADGSKSGRWNTLQIGFSRPLTRKTTFQCEAAVVLSGFSLASSRWVGGWPVILTTGVSHRF